MRVAGGADGAAAGDGPREDTCILYVINEAWFFRSHFSPWAKAAEAAGFTVEVLAAPEAQPPDAAASGPRLHAAVARRRGLLPTGLWAAAGQLRDLCRGRRVIVHAFGLHGMAITALARLRGLRGPRVVSITGLGFLVTLPPLAQRLARLVAAGLARAVDGRRTAWLAENSHDPEVLRLGPALRAGRVTTLTGAGVDAAAFAVAPLPPRPPLKLVLVARMVRSKGADLAVAAVAKARAEGIAVDLTVVGDADPANPRAVRADDLAAMAAVPGVTLLGRRTDVAGLLAGHHLFILPSRGGEGLPRALLEAAAAGRAAIVTDVPGCRDFVTDGETGFVVPPEDVAALAGAIRRAAESDLTAMGAAARTRVEASATIDHVAGQVVGVYRRLAQAAGPGAGG